MLRMRLGAEDLGRIRLAAAPPPIVEVTLMMAELRRRTAVAPAWRHEVRSSMPAAARLLSDLSAPGPTAYLFDTLTPETDEARRLIRAMPRSLYDIGVTDLRRKGPCRVPPWIRRFGEGDRAARQSLDRAFATFHDAFVAPRWPAVRTGFHDDVAERAATLRDSGVAELLNSLHPAMRLTGLTIEIDGRDEPELDLVGRGITLVPSVFWTGPPIPSWDPADPSRAVLVYAARPDDGTRAPEPRRPAGGALVALLGASRAAVLRALRQPLTTSGIARTAGISVPSASEHAGTLRAAGLVTSRRRGKAVEHRLTDLGRSLLLRD